MKIPQSPIDEKEVERGISLFHYEDDTFEIRVLGIQGATYNGHQDSRHYPTAFGQFRSPKAAAREVARVLSSAKFAGAYLTMNPANPAVFSRAANRIKPAGPKDSTTSDADIVRRRRLLVDFDAKRPANVSASDEEHDAAIDLARRCRASMIARGWPAPTLCDSGNGAHLIWEIDLPADDGGLVKRVLQNLQTDFGTDDIKVDQSVFNPARIVKLYGTLAGKGDDTPERPHRMSKILEVPDDFRTVPKAMLEEYAQPRASNGAGPTATDSTADDTDLERIIRKHRPDARKRTTADGSTVYSLEPCPWNPDHKTGGFAGVRPNGAKFAGCEHDGCAGRTWQDFKTAFGMPSKPKQEPGEPDSATTVRLCDVQPERVEWLWLHRIAIGKVAVFQGDPGKGKSFLTMELAACVSTGAPLPGSGQFGPADVIVMTAEDGLADTVRPRLEAAGADVSRITALTTIRRKGKECFPSLLKDVELIEKVVRDTGARLVIIDPLAAFLLGSDSHKDTDVRQAIAPVAAMAERTGAAVVFVSHLNKAGGSQAIYRGNGSIGIVGAARTVFLVASKPGEHDKRVIAGIKNNLAPMPPTLAFRIEGSSNGAARVRFDPRPLEMSADDILRQLSDESTGKATARNEAADFLKTLLQNGPVAQSTIKDEAEAAGHAWATIRRAKQKLKVSAVKTPGKAGVWMWSLPAEDGAPEDVQ